MDLVNLERTYRNRIIVMIAIYIVVLLIIAIFIGNRVLNSNRKEESYELYLKQYKLAQKIEKQEKIKNQENEIIKKYEEEKKIQEQKILRNPNLTEEGISNMGNIYKSEIKRAFLTFDDGPSKPVTIPILDLLKQENIKATFFVLGGRVELYPDIVKRAYQEGHYIANHGYTHTYSQIYSSPQAVIDEFNKTNQAVQRAIGNNEYNSHLFRFPGGKPGGRYAQIKTQAATILKENNIAYVDWNCMTGDAEGKNTVEAMMQELQSSSQNRNSLVILMHDAGDKQATYEALPHVIQYLRDQGYEFRNFYDIIK